MNHQTRRFHFVIVLVVVQLCNQRSSDAAPVRSNLNEVSWLQQYVDQGFLQYEVARHQPLSSGAVSCNVNGNTGAASFSDINCQQYSFLSAAYGVVLGPNNATDGRDYIHHALAILTYAINPYQNQSAGNYPIPQSCGSHPSDWCAATDLTFAYTDFAHTLELLAQSPFYQQADTEDHAIVSGTILPSMSKGLAWLSQSGSGQPYPDMFADNTATNRIFIHAGAYYLTGAMTSSYNSSIGTTGVNDGIQFMIEGMSSSHYIYAPGSSYTCVPTSLCPWPQGSAFWTEDQDSAGSTIGFDSGYGGVAIREADFLDMHTTPSSTTATLDTQLQAYSTWEYGRVVPSTGVITEEGNYRTCAQPVPPSDTMDCMYTTSSGTSAVDNVNMNWEDVAWSLYNEAPFAPDNSNVSCAKYVAAARAISYYYMPVSSYLILNAGTHYPNEQASGYNIPSPSAAAPAACSTPYSSVHQATLGPGSKARAVFDSRSEFGGVVSLNHGDSIVFPNIDAALRYTSKSIAIGYSLSGNAAQAISVRINGSAPQTVILKPTTSKDGIRRCATVDLPAIDYFSRRVNTLSIAAIAGPRPVEIESVTPRLDVTTLRPR